MILKWQIENICSLKDWERLSENTRKLRDEKVNKHSLVHSPTLKNFHPEGISLTLRRENIGQMQDNLLHTAVKKTMQLRGNLGDTQLCLIPKTSSDKPTDS